VLWAAPSAQKFFWIDVCPAQSAYGAPNPGENGWEGVACTSGTGLVFSSVPQQHHNSKREPQSARTAQSGGGTSRRMAEKPRRVKLRSRANHCLRIGRSPTAPAPHTRTQLSRIRSCRFGQTESVSSEARETPWPRF